MARSEQFKVGLLVIAALVILTAIVVAVAGIGLRERRHDYTLRFSESVSGLDPGGDVKYRGVAVGRVEQLFIPEDDITKIEVRIAVREGTPITADTKARLSSVGITGLKFIDLIGGSPDQPPLGPGSRIETEESFLEAMTGRAATAAEKADVLLENLIRFTSQEDYEVAKQGIGELKQSLATDLEQLGELLGVMTQAATRLDAVLATLNDGRLDRSLSSLEGALDEIHATAARVNEGELIDNLNSAARSARDAMTGVSGMVGANRRTVSEALANLRETASNLNEFSRLVRERPSLLVRSSSPEPRRIRETD